MTTVLVTGASGTTGSRVAARLMARGVNVRAASRSSEIAFDWYEPGSHARALAGVDAMYLVPPTRDLEPHAVMLPFLDLARKAGVRRAVLLSSALAEPGGPMTGVVHQAIADSFSEWAVLRPGWFMQNVIGAHAHATCIRATSAIATSAGDGRAAFIDAGDIAAVAVEALLAPEALNTDLILTGPQSLNYDDVARILSETSGHPIVHKRLDPADEPAYYRALGVSEYTANLLVGMDWVISSGREDRTTDTVERVIGTAPRTFRDFAAAEFRL